MARLSWSAVGQRFYEIGVDRGVLYVGNQPGVAWTGLTSVSESPKGGEPRPYYIDGVKYLNVASAEEFEATIDALSCPPEFGQCDGTSSISNGLFVTQQPRKPFGFSYRTRIGNDVDGPSHGYKIHIVYNALAAPTSRNNKSLGDSVEPIGLSWSITTLPPALTGYKRTAHFVIDSRTTPKNLLTTLEDILYGSPLSAPRLPSAQELVDLFTGLGPVLYRNLVTNPRFEDAPTLTVIRTNLFPDPTVNQAGSPRWGSNNGTSAQSNEQAFSGSNSYKVVATGGATFGGYGSTLAGSVSPGDPIYGSVHVYSSVATTVQIGVEFKNSANAWIGEGLGSQVAIPANTWTRVGGYGGLAPANTSYVTVTCYTQVNAVAGQLMYLDGMLVEKSATLRSYFQGDFTSSGIFVYRWTGTAFASTSEQCVPLATGQTGTASNAYSFVWWVDGTGTDKYGRWRSKAGTPATTWRVARSKAISHAGIVAGQTYTLMGRMRRSGWTSGSIPIRLSNSNGLNEIMPSANISNVGSDWFDFRIVFTALIDASVDSDIGFYASLPNTPPATEDGYFDLAYWSVISGDYQGDYFDGATPDANMTFYEWEGVPNASTSVIRSWIY